MKKMTIRIEMSKSSAMPRVRGSARVMPAGSWTVGSGRGRRFDAGAPAFPLPLPFPFGSFGGGGASSLRQPVSW